MPESTLDRVLDRKHYCAFCGKECSEWRKSWEVEITKGDRIESVFRVCGFCFRTRLDPTYWRPWA